MSILGAGLMAGSMAFDVIGGNRAKKKHKRLWEQFQQDLRRREGEQVDLERIARGELQTSLAEGKKYFTQTMKAISASDSVASRRLMEDIARREAEADVRGRQRGMMGSSVTSTEALAREREIFRGALDAEANRSARMGQVLQGQAGFEAGVRGQIAGSYRNEGLIHDRAGQDLRRALEGSSVQHSGISGGVGQILGGLGMLGPGRETEERELSYSEGKAVNAAFIANPFTPGFGR